MHFKQTVICTWYVRLIISEAIVLFMQFFGCDLPMFILVVLTSLAHSLITQVMDFLNGGELFSHLDQMFGVSFHDSSSYLHFLGVIVGYSFSVELAIIIITHFVLMLFTRSTEPLV